MAFSVHVGSQNLGLNSQLAISTCLVNRLMKLCHLTGCDWSKLTQTEVA